MFPLSHLVPLVKIFECFDNDKSYKILKFTVKLCKKVHKN